ncbi:PqqD family protein [Phosphitispora fastidiosa]|uniref:PqqD family protein n=1 Tax=Phosphitispora fastidiosa TaxID=2837202 RepID=UPI001E5B8311|nr:PqqD family protein [Phosphitispora fastidiosa]MBU7007242.1 methyltransferase-like protein [Phosphitispora fastidiosa]
MTEAADFCRNSAMITRVIDGEAVIMDPQQGKVLALNEVGSFIWELLDGARSKEDILAEICREFNVGREVAAADLEEFIAVLKSKSLVVTA